MFKRAVVWGRGSLLAAAGRRPIGDRGREATRPYPSMTLNVYGHVISELEGIERVLAEETVRRAREKLVLTRYSRAANEDTASVGIRGQD